MPVGKITVETVKAAPVPEKGKREHLWDDDVKGFGLMVTDKGVRSYILQYRVGGRGSPTRRVTIGRHGSPWTPATARKRALELLEQVRRKVDPFDAERAAVAAAQAEKVQAKAVAVIETKLAFDKIAKDYIAKGTFVDGKRIRSWVDYERIIERDLKPKFGSTPLTRISGDDITELLLELEDRAPMRSIERRVSALETAKGSGVQRWHQIIVDGCTEDEAIARYEAENGPLGDDGAIIVRFIVDPPEVPANGRWKHGPSAEPYAFDSAELRG